ncbi:Ionotropic receptor 109, partial [Frankliniella occidentalis]
SILPLDNSCLVVHGDAQLAEPLLQSLWDSDRGRQTIVMNASDTSSHTFAQMQFAVNLHVFAAVSAANLLTALMHQKGEILSYSELVLWTRARSVADALQDPAGPGMPLWICSRNVHLVVTTPNGTTIQFVPAIRGNCVVKWSDLKLREVRRCDPGRRRWQGQPLRRLCSRWKAPKMTPQFLSVSTPHFRQIDGAADYNEPFNRAASTMTTAVSRWLRTPIGLTWKPNIMVIVDQISNCSLNAAFINYPVKVRFVSNLEFDSLFMAPTIVVVPIGSAVRLNVLSAVTSEFSAELWVATALALLFMTAAMAMAWTTLGRPPLAALAVALLQTVAPLLAQSPPGRTAHRPLSAVWLLMSVVLAAA